jgi:hypothetical protein
MRCPVCRAETPWSAPCRRCRADLSLLEALEESRDQALAQAARAVAAGQPVTARTWAEWAHHLRPDADSACALAVVYLLERNFAAAWQMHRQQSNYSKSSATRQEKSGSTSSPVSVADS